MRDAAQEGVEYTVLLFPHDRRHGGVSTSALVRRALKRVQPEMPLLAVGLDFTREATEQLHAVRALIVRLGEFGWTDESYVRVRTPAR